ncbi:hypothetical protein F5144DRAFT_479806 [Chaetomium tenue]|uniref:Uncharacterized protein n=1 Tax=Chaetomium tenue TaxID=1854479 RepID=A0ACB7PSS5_9PEZI|nr:hypothetical protein F5144DRAFT_479806 [Chaetomium globosum]
MKLCDLFAGAVISASAAASSWEYAWPEEWHQEWPLDEQGPDAWSSSECTVSRLDAFEMEKGRKPVFFSTDPLDDPEAPKMLPLNSTGGEQWEFDGVSEDGQMAFCFGFYRDPNYAILGTGNLRLSAEFSRPNNTRFVRVDYPSSSTVTSCPWGTRGVWKGADYSYTFEITRDIKVARIGVDAPDLKGSVVMRSVMPPRYPDGSTYPNKEASTEVVPYFRWLEAIPAADVRVDVVMDGQSYQWSGLGGHERLWTAFSWFTCLQAMTAVRVKAGPFAAVHGSFVSAIDKGLYRPSTVLAQNGEVIFSTTLHEPSETEDYAVFTKTYGGRVSGNLKEKAAGYELVMVSPSAKKQWSFSITNEAIGFEYMLGEGVGGTGFSGRAVGGSIGLKQYFGPSFAETLEFPKRSYLFKSNYVDAVPEEKGEL